MYKLQKEEKYPIENGARIGTVQLSYLQCPLGWELKEGNRISILNHYS
jgi:hypothetical protein